jgi:Cu/Ag efflux protein CusF
MMAMVTLVICLVSFGLLVRVVAQEAEHAVKFEELPKAVQQTATEQSKGATVRGYSAETNKIGHVHYEMETVTAAGLTRDLLLESSGKILSIEEEVKMDSNDVPAPVRETLQKYVKGIDGTVAKLERVMKADGTIIGYDADIQSEVSLNADGSLKKAAAPPVN